MTGCCNFNYFHTPGKVDIALPLQKEKMDITFSHQFSQKGKMRTALKTVAIIIDDSIKPQKNKPAPPEKKTKASTGVVPVSFITEPFIHRLFQYLENALITEKIDVIDRKEFIDTALKKQLKPDKTIPKLLGADALLKIHHIAFVEQNFSKNINTLRLERCSGDNGYFSSPVTHLKYPDFYLQLHGKLVMHTGIVAATFNIQVPASSLIQKEAYHAVYALQNKTELNVQYIHKKTKPSYKAALKPSVLNQQVSGLNNGLNIKNASLRNAVLQQSLFWMVQALFNDVEVESEKQ